MIVMGAGPMCSRTASSNVTASFSVGCAGKEHSDETKTRVLYDGVWSNLNPGVCAYGLAVKFVCRNEGQLDNFYETFVNVRDENCV